MSNFLYDKSVELRKMRNVNRDEIRYVKRAVWGVKDK